MITPSWIGVLATHYKKEEISTDYVLHYLGVAIQVFTMIQNAQYLKPISKSTTKNPKTKLNKVSNEIFKFYIEEITREKMILPFCVV